MWLYIVIENLKYKHGFKSEIYFEDYLITTINTKNATLE